MCRPTEKGDEGVEIERGRFSRCNSGERAEGARCGSSRGGNQWADGEPFHSEGTGHPSAWNKNNHYAALKPLSVNIP